MFRTILRNALVFVLLSLALSAGATAFAAALPGGDELWYRPAPPTPAERSVRLYVFWSSRCPHCAIALPFVDELAERYPWLQPESLEIYDHPEHRQRFQFMADVLGSTASSVPTFMWCGREAVGFTDVATSGRLIENGLRECYADVYGEPPPQAAVDDAAPDSATTPRQNLPGNLDAERLSLPVLTVTMAGLDAFNPCAFFILLMLLSLLVHARDRRRMLLVGGIFVFFSGLIYFLFMAAWLNAFRWIGGIQAATLAAGLVTVAIGLINIKDFFWFKRGVSLSMSEASRSKLAARMRGLLRDGNFAALIFGTAALAIAANTYELLCTAGFPMAYTRILTLHELGTTRYYAYLALYNVVYVLPLLIIVLVFVTTLGARKLSETEGRALKLMSGLMMLGLGLLLLFAPQALSDGVPALAVPLFALALTWVLVRVRRTMGR